MPETPPYLQHSEPMEIEALPLQVALLTMEVAALRKEIEALAVMTDAEIDRWRTTKK
jgi:hypothetical protein